MTITRDEAITALRPLFPGIEQRHERVRIVGTASSLLRGDAVMSRLPPELEVEVRAALGVTA